MYDIIGDVHGYASLLKKVLKKRGYKKKNGTYRHPSSTALFVGDFINRGPEIRETLAIIRSMVEAGNAYALLGNHELNALIRQLKDDKGMHLIQKNISGYYKTVKAFRNDKEEWKSHRRWMRTLPLFFENAHFRVVHAYWNDENIDFLRGVQAEGRIRKSLLRKIYDEPDSREGRSVWQTTKGIQYILPRDMSIRNAKGASVRSYRMRWWEDPHGKTFNALSFESKMTLPEYTIPPEILPDTKPYDPEAPLVFFGHYCRGKGPFLLGKNICCVDSCVTGTKILTAYAWEGETELIRKNLIQV
jgi:hypothetical protein